MEGLLMRDLQLRPHAKAAYFARPLPARAAQLAARSTHIRRLVLRVTEMPPAVKR